MYSPPYFATNLGLVFVIGVLLGSTVGIWSWVIALFVSPLVTFVLFRAVEAMKRPRDSAPSGPVHSGRSVTLGHEGRISSPAVGLLPQTQSLLEHLLAEHGYGEHARNFEANVAKELDEANLVSTVFGSERDSRQAQAEVLTDAHDALEFDHRFAHKVAVHQGRETHTQG